MIRAAERNTRCWGRGLLLSQPRTKARDSVAPVEKSPLLTTLALAVNPCAPVPQTLAARFLKGLAGETGEEGLALGRACPPTGQHWTTC
eukprot:4058338-Pyramimonas_sp.AAC.1